MLDILEKLVSFNTIKDKENQLINDYLEAYLKTLGFQTKRIGKCLIAQNDNQPNIGFIGHTDTVNYVSWDGNPFELKKQEDKLFGLGVCDMKGGIAAILSALQKIDLSKNKLALYFTNDEEINFKGIRKISKLPLPKIIIIGEPTDNILVYGTKGLLELKIIFKGKSAHASTPEQGINAIYMAIRFIEQLTDYYENIKKDTCNTFEIPYTSMNIGLIKGGEAINSVPQQCQLTIDFRVINAEHLSKITNDIKEMLNSYDANLVIKNSLEPKIAHQNWSFLGINTKTANYITEGSFIDSETIILGPGPITAHQKNEYITIESLVKTEELYIKIIKKYNEEG